MAKKILSFLCALAVLVSMTAIGLSAVFAEETSTPEGDEEFNLLDSTNITDWTVTRPKGWNYYSGAVDLTSFNLEGITGALAIPKHNSQNEALPIIFTYGEELDLGDDFAILMTAFLGTNTTPTAEPAAESYIELALGDYAIRMVREVGTTDDANRKFVLALLKDGTELKRTTGYINTAEKTTSLYNGAPYTNAKSGDVQLFMYGAGSVSDYLCTMCPGDNGNKVSTASSTWISYNNDNGWNDITVSVKDGVLTVSNYAGDQVLTQTLDAADSFEAVAPVVTIVQDGKFYNRPAGVFRLESYVEAPAGDEDDDDDDAVIEPAVVTFDATKGTVATATATVNAEGKLESLPTPTYSGAGTYTFDGWYTAAEGGTKVTTDTVFTEDTTVYAQWTRTLTTTAMDGFDKATCTIPDDINWNCSGSGLFKTSGYGDGLIIGASNLDFGLTAELGTYNIDSYFKVDFDIWYKNKGVASGCVAGTENWIMTFGDLVITFTRSPAEITDGEGKNIYLQSVTYKGQEVALTGDKNFGKDCVVFYEHNSEFVLTQVSDFEAYLEEVMLRKAWMFTNNFMPNCNMGVEITYDAGKLTIKNTTGETTNSVVADLTTVTGFDATTAFNNTKVTTRVEGAVARQTYASVISDFHGAYEKVGASAGTGTGTGTGSGTGTGTGTGTGNGGSNAPQTGDNRNVVLPICVALASVAVAGATIIRRKRA